MGKAVTTKREKEKELVSQMIALYCRKQHGRNKQGLCTECAELNHYARQRSDKCPFMETKTFCSNCKVHCYQPVMREKIMKIKKLLWIILGFMGLGIGSVGVVLPMLPAFPFLLLAAFSFGKSSEKLHTWFVGTRLYKNNLESYVKGQGMTNKTKIRIIIMVTLLMGFGFFMMMRRNLYIPCAILGGVWLFHIIYFVFGVKTWKEKDAQEEKESHFDLQKKTEKCQENVVTLECSMWQQEKQQEC